MVFIADLNGTTTLAESTPIYQGSSLANSVTIVCPMARNNNVTVAFRLANGMPTKPLLMTRLNNSIIGDNIVGELNAWSVELDTSITEYAGIVDVQFYFYQGYSNGSALAIQPTFKTSFEVQPGVVPELPETPSQNIYEQLLSALTNAENKIFGKLELFSENVFNVKTWLDAVDGTNGDTFIANRIDPTDFFLLSNPIFDKGVVSTSRRIETSVGTSDWTVELEASIPSGNTLLSIYNGNTIVVQNTGAQYSVLLNNNLVANVTYTEGEVNDIAISKSGTTLKVYFNATEVGSATITNSGAIADITVGINGLVYYFSTLKIYDKAISEETLYNSWQGQVYRLDKINAAEEYKLDLLMTYSQDIARILQSSAGFNNATFDANTSELVFYVNESIVKEVDISSVNNGVKANAYGNIDVTLDGDTLELSPDNLNGEALTPKSVTLPFAKKGTSTYEEGRAYTVNVPENSAPYAKISRIGGMSRKCTNILPRGTKYNWACDVTIADDGTITYTRTANGGVCFIDSNKVYLEANKTYALRYSGSNNKYAILQTEADSFRTDIYGGRIYTPTESGYYYIRVYMSDSLTSVGDSATVKIWIHEGNANLPYEPYYSGLRDAKVTEVKSVGVNKVNPAEIPDTRNGMTFTKNLDGSVIINGTGNAYTTIYVYNFPIKQGERFYVFGGGSGAIFTFNGHKNGAFVKNIGSAIDDSVRSIVCDGTYDEVFSIILINSGTSFSNVNVKFMVSHKPFTEFSPYQEHTLAIPESVQSLEGYGQSNPDNAEEYNYIDLKNQKFISFGYISNSVWVSRYSTTDIDISNIIGVEGNGTLTFENEYGYNVPYEIEYTLDSNEVIGAEEFVGNLKGTAEVAKYYDINGSPSTQTIAEALNKLLGAGNPIKITTESIGQLSTTQVLTGINANIVANPPVAVNDIILDRYLDGDAAYLCFWLVTAIEQTGAYNSNMTLQGADNIYVGGGSASIADRAIADGNGNNIVSTYETKTEAQTSHGLLASNIVTNANNISANSGEIANIKSGTTVVGTANYANNPSGNLDTTITNILTELARAVTRDNFNTNYFNIVNDLITVIKADSATYATGNNNETIDARITYANSLATTAVNTANTASTRASRGIQRAYCTYTSGASSVGTFHLYLQTVDNATIEVENFSANMESFIGDFILFNQ